MADQNTTTDRTGSAPVQGVGSGRRAITAGGVEKRALLDHVSIGPAVATRSQLTKIGLRPGKIAGSVRRRQSSMCTTIVSAVGPLTEDGETVPANSDVTLPAPVRPASSLSNIQARTASAAEP
jgi:hypothetical protein